MPIKKKGLGKGLDSLIPDNKSIKSVTPDSSVYYSRCLFGKERIITKSLPVKEDGELQNLPG